MKQKKSNWHIAKVIIRNLARLFWAIVCYLAVETKYRFKWLYQDLKAVVEGYGSHAKKIQKFLDHNHRVYAKVKKYNWQLDEVRYALR